MSQLNINHNPFDIFREWYQLASKIPDLDPSAASLATASLEGTPSVRMILVKEYNEKGFVFYTNLNSRKAKNLRENPKAAICFYWHQIAKQVRIEGDVHNVSAEEADCYFKSRPRPSQIGAWASLQSEVMINSNQLQLNYAKLEEAFADQAIPRPPHWAGFRIIPKMIEYWSQGDYRLHQRVLFEKTEHHQWAAKYLFP